jgi:hypothetical protein
MLACSLALRLGLGAIIVCIIHPTECTVARPSKVEQDPSTETLRPRGPVQPDASGEAVH